MDIFETAFEANSPEPCGKPISVVGARGGLAHELGRGIEGSRRLATQDFIRGNVCGSLANMALRYLDNPCRRDQCTVPCFGSSLKSKGNEQR